jgi:DNA repair protein RecO (recombination protein O)
VNCILNMHITTQGIVVQTIRYSDSKLIIKALCANIGYKSFIVLSSKRPTTSTQHLFQPLRILEFETDFQEVSKFLSMKAPRLVAPLHNLTTDPIKMAMTLFMDEVLAKTLADDYSNESLFLFLKNSISLLDDAIDAKNFHLWWLVEMTRYYGFYPNKNEGAYFDLQQAHFTSRHPSHPHYLEAPVSAVLYNMLDKEWPQAQQMELHSTIRKQLLAALVTYLKLHLDNLREIKSLDVLHAVFH